MFASPALLRNLADHLTALGRPLPDLRCVVSGGAPVPDSVVAALRTVLDEKASVHVTYGATEVLPITSIESEEILGETSAGSARGAGTCIGRPVPGTRVRIIPVTDGPLAHLHAAAALPAGHVGEILVEGESVSPRYHDAPRSDALHKVLETRPDAAALAWHRTGDLGCLDDRGRLWFCGRTSQRVRAAGGDLYTVRCEGVFNAHPLVRRSALVGIGPAGAQRPVVCVESDVPADSPAWQDLVAELRALAADHVPTRGWRSSCTTPPSRSTSATTPRSAASSWPAGPSGASPRPRLSSPGPARPASYRSPAGRTSSAARSGRPSGTSPTYPCCAGSGGPTPSSAFPCTPRRSPSPCPGPGPRATAARPPPH